MVASVWGSSQSVLYNGVEFQRAQFQQGSSNYHYAMGICNNGMQLLCDSYGEEQNTQLLMNENNATGQSDDVLSLLDTVAEAQVAENNAAPDDVLSLLGMLDRQSNSQGAGASNGWACG